MQVVANKESSDAPAGINQLSESEMMLIQQQQILYLQTQRIYYHYMMTCVPHEGNGKFLKDATNYGQEPPVKRQRIEKETKHPRKHTCSVCNKGYTTKKNLKEHVLKKHPNEAGKLHPNEKPKETLYQCPVKGCRTRDGKPYETKDKRNFHRHINNAHKEQNDPSTNKHICEICKKTFAQKGTLNNHMNTHTRLQKFPCPHCTQVAWRKGDLTKHINRNHK